MVTECPICKLPRFHGVAGYAGPQCKCQFATLPQMHDKLRADYDAQAAELAKWEKAFTEVHKPALEESHQYIGDLRAELAEARELLSAASTLFGPLCTDSTQRDWSERIDAFLGK